MLPYEARALLLGLLLAFIAQGLFLSAIILALLIERIYFGRRLERALERVSLLQSDLFSALTESYKRVEQSHSMVIRMLRVVDQTLGIKPEEPEDQDPEWPGVIGNKKSE